LPKKGKKMKSIYIVEKNKQIIWAGQTANLPARSRQHRNRLATSPEDQITIYQLFRDLSADEANRFEAETIRLLLLGGHPLLNKSGGVTSTGVSAGKGNKGAKLLTFLLPDGKIKKFKSEWQAARKFGVSQSTISLCTAGKTKYFWVVSAKNGNRKMKVKIQNEIT